MKAECQGVETICVIGTKASSFFGSWWAHHRCAARSVTRRRRGPHRWRKVVLDAYAAEGRPVFGVQHLVNTMTQQPTIAQVLLRSRLPKRRN
jgi:hypothetical protein